MSLQELHDWPSHVATRALRACPLPEKASVNITVTTVYSGIGTAKAAVQKSVTALRAAAPTCDLKLQCHSAWALDAECHKVLAGRTRCPGCIFGDVLQRLDEHAAKFKGEKVSARRKNHSLEQGYSFTSNALERLESADLKTTSWCYVHEAMCTWVHQRQLATSLDMIGWTWAGTLVHLGQREAWAWVGLQRPPSLALCGGCH